MLAEREPDLQFRLGSPPEEAQPGPAQQEKSSLTGRIPGITSILRPYQAVL